MQAGNNSKYQVSLNSSPFALGQNYNVYLSDLAKMDLNNIIINENLNIKENAVIVGWEKSGTPSVTAQSNYSNVSMTTGEFLYQNITDKLEPNTGYSVILNCKKYTVGSEATTFSIEVSAVGTIQQLYNLEEYSQNPVSAICSPSSTGTYDKILIQFVTSASLSSTDIKLKIKNHNADKTNFIIKNINLYKGLIEVNKIPKETILELKTLARGTSALPSLAFYNDPDTGLYSPDVNQIALSVSGGISKITVSPTAVNISSSGASGLKNNGYTVLDSNNFNNWVPNLTGSGANGLWNITASGAVSGTFSTSAASANFSTSAASANFSSSAASANFATSAASANIATSAASANFATLAVSANFASAVSANYATSAGAAPIQSSDYMEEEVYPGNQDRRTVTTIEITEAYKYTGLLIFMKTYDHENYVSYIQVEVKDSSNAIILQLPKPPEQLGALAVGGGDNHQWSFYYYIPIVKKASSVTIKGLFDTLSIWKVK